MHALGDTGNGMRTPFAAIACAPSLCFCPVLSTKMVILIQEMNHVNLDRKAKNHTTLGRFVFVKAKNIDCYQGIHPYVFKQYKIG